MPAIDVELELASGTPWPTKMLPDSGASFTVLPRKYAVPLGFDVRGCEKVSVDTGNGPAVHYRAPRTVTATIAGRSIELEPCFSDIGVPVLGRGDFFKEFYVEVDEDNSLVAITPHGEIPQGLTNSGHFD